MESLMDEAKNALLLRSREAKRLRVSATYDSEIGARAEAAGMYLRALHGQCDMLETNKTVIINSIREEFAQLQVRARAPKQWGNCHNERLFKCPQRRTSVRM